MILDSVPIAGRQANFLGPGAGNNRVENLIDATPDAGGARRGALFEVSEGTLTEIDGIDVLIEHDALGPALAARTGMTIEVSLHKEMFPGLFADPYAHRVHHLAGLEDLSDGEGQHVRVHEIDDVATLVSVGSETSCAWSSAWYELPAPVTFSAAAWDIPMSRHGRVDRFVYTLSLVARHGNGAVETHALAANRGADAARSTSALNITDVRRYRLELTADVKSDSYIHEQVHRQSAAEALGQPLLTGVHLLEVVPHAHVYETLHELLAGMRDYAIVDGSDGRPRYVTGTLDYTAAVGRRERLEIALKNVATGWLRFQARATGSIAMRPPRGRE
jgi:hypothetical protein